MRAPCALHSIRYILYIIFHFINDYKTNSLDSLTRFQTRANQPQKLGYLPPHNSLAGDYFSAAGKISYPQVYFHFCDLFCVQHNLLLTGYVRG
jgi:hypothetical protein